ncbi:MAG TPA: ROK family protein [Candidatus Dormibacteraeota bacterium]|nr:ROK family protein [Candidatus Dormibacteraeota bacterium]
MGKLVGVHVVQRISAGLVENNRVVGGVRSFPEKGATHDALLSMPADDIALAIAIQVKTIAKGEKLEAVGIGFPGFIRNGVAEESPNLQQMKGFHLQNAVEAALAKDGTKIPVGVFNDADATAAGIAATRGVLHKLNRVWAIGNGVGYGRFPWTEGVWEGGHSVVTLDPKERFCGCGGVGHLEGFLGYRSMRLRFLDMEPEEVFANAKAGDARCAEFVVLCHRALAAASATSIHMAGPGPFYLTGPNAGFLDVGLLDRFVHEMVKMSPLQGSRFELIPENDELGVIGAAVNAERAVRGH